MVDIIRRVTIQGRSEGLDKAATDLRNVATAQKEVASASQATATVTEVSSRKTLSAAAAYDRLQRSLDPVYQAQQRLAAAERVLGRAHDQGLIGLSRQNELLALAAQRYQALVPAINPVAAGMSQSAMASERLIAGMSAAGAASATTASAIKLTSFEMQNLSFQINDVVMGLATGQRPLTVAMQQGSQIIQIFQTRLVSIGAAIGSFFLTPMGAAAAAAIALGAAFATAAAVIISRLPTVDHAIEVHKNAIEAIRAAWKDAEKGSDSYRDRALASMQFLANQSKIEQQRLLDFQLRGAANQLSSVSSQFAITPTQRAIHEFQPDIDKFLASIASGKNDVEGFSAAIDMRANIDPTNKALQDAAKALHDVIDGAKDSTQRLKELRGEFVNLRIDSAFSAASQGPTPADQAARDLDAARRRHQVELDAIAARSPADRAAVARGFESALPMNETESPEGRQFRIDAAGAEAYAAALHAVSEAEISRKVARDNAIESANVELSLVGKGIAEQERLTQQTQMLQQAKEAARQAGTVVSQEEIDQINAAAAALGKLNEQIALKQLRSDLSFERSTMFSSDTEQRVAGSMRDTFGDDWQAHMQDAEAGMIRMNEHLAEARDLTKDFASTFIDGWQSGKGVIESLGAAVDQLEKKFLDMALNQAINGLFASLAGSLGGGLSPAAGGLTGAGLFHQGGLVGSGGATRYVHPAYFDNAPRMHGGGIAGDEVPAILRRGERVLPVGSSGVNVQLQVIDQSQRSAPVTATVENTRGPSGEHLLKVFIRDQVTKMVPEPAMAR